MMATIAPGPFQMGTMTQDQAAKRTGAQSAASAARTSTEPPPPPERSAPINPQASWGGDFGVPSRRWPVSLLASFLIHGAVIGITMLSLNFHWGDNAPPPAAMVVELAVMPASQAQQPNETPPGPEQVEAAPKPLPLDRTKFDPPPQVDAALKPDFAMPIKPQIQLADVPRVAETARETTAPPTIPVPARDKTAASVEGENVAAPSDAEQDWAGKVTAKLARGKRYPASAQAGGQEDTIFLRMTFDRKGKVLAIEIKKSKGFAMLDSETLDLAKRAAPYPAPPSIIAGERITRLFAVDYSLAKRR